MKVQHFREVVAIANAGSIRAAARYLDVAQPALTRSLAELEREIGAPLFERRPRGVVATPLGQAFALRAQLIVAEMRRMRDELDQLRGSTKGSVTVGLSIAAHLALLPSILRPFRTRYPDTRLHVIEGFYPTLESGLRGGTVDFYVGPASGARLAPELNEDCCSQTGGLSFAGSGIPWLVPEHCVSFPRPGRRAAANSLMIDSCAMMP
jgi:LysR family transcriptional regulator, regulator of abg operon